MSESSLPFAARAASGTPTGLPEDAGLLRSLAPLLARWLPRQRWFAGKNRSISGFSLVAATELMPCAGRGSTPGLLHLLLRARQPGRPEETGGAAHDDCYQLLLGVREVLPPGLTPALIGRPATGPLRGRTVYEALCDPRLTGLLLDRLRAPGRLGALRFVREPDTPIPSGLPPKPLAAEQSNSSVVYGSAYILKLFRRVEPGVNPDLELPLALARHGCDRVPAPSAWFEATPSHYATDREDGPEAGPGRAGGAPEPSGPSPYGTLTLGVLQPFLPGTRDGWQLALRALSAHSDFTHAATALGRTTAEVHTGLAEALPTTVLRRPQLEDLAEEMANRLEAATATVPSLRPYRPALLGAYRALAELGREGRSCQAQRVHGDLHLGQVLGVVGEPSQGALWSVIDFEGEPSRPLSERLVPQPVVRDIAGMLRSFDYAASQRTAGDSGTEDPYAREWAAANRAAYCRGYADACGTDPREEAVLLRAYETDKAVYEALYEAHHRPDWLPIPLAAIRRLADAGL